MARLLTLGALCCATSAMAQITFTSVVVPGAIGIMGVVDMNNDGLDDLVMPAGTYFNVGYQGAGGFSVVTFPTTPADNAASWSFAVGDWDSNGYRDLLYGGDAGATFMNANVDGTAYTEVSFAQYIFCQRTNFVDLNNDGNLDAFSCHDVDANVAFLNDGTGNLVFDQGGYGTTCGNYGSIFSDADNDGDMDLFVAKCGCDPEDLLMINDGNGVFTNIAPAQGLDDYHQSWSSAWADLDNDGDMDMLIGESDSFGNHKLMENDGAGNFTDVTAGSGMDLFSGSSIEWTAHDFNNDGYVDILGGGGLHLGNGDMTFTTVTGAVNSGAIGDMDNDGYLDISVYNGYYRNNATGNNWIRIIPVGVTSNRDAIGARVIITSALGTQIREVRSGDGFALMSFIGAHFGLGADATVQQVEIHWPSGSVDVFNGLAINSTHTLIEGSSTGIAGVAENAVSIAPNPAVDVVYISGLRPNADVQVLDANGQLVLNTRLVGNELNVGRIASGVYQLRAFTKEGVLSTRLLKR